MAKQFQVDTNHTLTTSLVSYWKEEDLTDFYGSNNQTGVNSPTFVAGKVNNAINFAAGSSQYSTFTRTGFPTGSSDRSLALWVNFTSLPTGDTYLFSYGTRVSNQEWGIAIRKSGTNYVLLFDRFNAGDAGTVNLISGTGTWINLIFIYNGTANTLKAYVNGTLTDTVTTGTENAGTADFGDFATRQDQGAGTFFDGKMDEVGFWSKQLSAQEITDLYHGGAGQTMIDVPSGFYSQNLDLIPPKIEVIAY
jgi:hypothetical protein